jgi:hypothetical protein
MSEQQELMVAPRDEVAPVAASVAALPQEDVVPAPNPRVEAGRKGGRRVHELIREGRLYEKEHGLESGRQRLRQLIELGKAYEVAHGLRPARKKRGERLSRLGREELLATFLRCLLRIAKPSFRSELVRLVEALSREDSGHAA